MATLSIVIPAYNEAGAIADIIYRVLASRAQVTAANESIREVELIVVNDASRARTAEIVAKYPEVRPTTKARWRGWRSRSCCSW